MCADAAYAGRDRRGFPGLSVMVGGSFAVGLDERALAPGAEMLAEPDRDRRGDRRQERHVGVRAADPRRDVDVRDRARAQARVREARVALLEAEEARRIVEMRSNP
jgi:hypothetical protein